jgi:hypothetical protein
MIKLFEEYSKMIMEFIPNIKFAEFYAESNDDFSLAKRNFFKFLRDNLIGKRVKFIENCNKRDSRVRHIYNNLTDLQITFETEEYVNQYGSFWEYQTYKVDPKKKVIVYETVYTEEDPYGEEEWEINESNDNKIDEFVPDLLLKDLYNIFSDIDQSRKIIIDYFKKYKGRYIKFYSDRRFLEGYIKDVHYNAYGAIWIVLEGHQLGNTNIETPYIVDEMGLVKIYKGKTGGVISEKDPYGEEDWENESFSLEESGEFIPFEIRKKMDPDFDENNRYDISQRMSVVVETKKDKEYLWFMKRELIGKRVTFHTFSYRDGNEDVDSGIVVGIDFNFKRTMCFKLKGKDYLSKGAVDERKPIKYWGVPKKFVEQDPYGEEDWDNE